MSRYVRYLVTVQMAALIFHASATYILRPRRKSIKGGGCADNKLKALYTMIQHPEDAMQTGL